MVDLRRLGFEARELSAAALLAQVGSMAGLRTPLSTLHVRPHDRPRMTRGRCGSLLLHRNGLAPSALCRSPGAPDSRPSRSSERTEGSLTRAMIKTFGLASGARNLPARSGDRLCTSGAAIPPGLGK